MFVDWLIRGPDILFDNTLILLNNKMDICGCSKTQFPLINSRIGNVHLKTVSGSRYSILSSDSPTNGAITGGNGTQRNYRPCAWHGYACICSP